jgi:aspartate carbamoyltransferase catalytic subunit
MESRSASWSETGRFCGPHLTGLRNLGAPAIRSILDEARRMRSAGRGAHAGLAPGCQVALLFHENSTRTRMAFEAAAGRLGAVAMVLQAGSSSATKGETLSDTARVLESQGADLLVLRHPDPDSAEFLTHHVKLPVVNAGAGTGEHPTQALLDLLTLEDALGGLGGRRVVIVGDVAHSRVARSNLFGLQAMGARVVFCGPPTLVSPRWAELGVDVSHDLDEALAGADAVMGLRLQYERLEGDAPGAAGTLRSRYGITSERMRAHPALWVLHPGPVMRGAEIAHDVVDGERSLIFRQDENGLYVRMAVLAMLLASAGPRRAAKAAEPAGTPPPRVPVKGAR